MLHQNKPVPLHNPNYPTVMYRPDGHTIPRVHTQEQESELEAQGYSRNHPPDGVTPYAGSALAADEAFSAEAAEVEELEATGEAAPRKRGRPRKNAEG